MEQEMLTDTTSSVVTTLLEYGALGVFCTYLVVSNWMAQKRLDRLLGKSEALAGNIAEQLATHGTKLDQLIQSKAEDRLKKDLAAMIEAKD
tara:strand:+ start:7656 stop:7928 length:273 start_codon:yes stop_codon:yes gene_type:complete